jgi:hypothetical protein
VEVRVHAFFSLYEDCRLVVNLTLQQLDPLERAIDTHWGQESKTWGFLKVLSRIFLSWSNKLRGRDACKTLAYLRGIVIRKTEYAGVHCVDILSVMDFCKPCVLEMWGIS